MCTWPSCTFNQGCIDNNGTGLFHLQPVTLYLATDLGQQPIVSTCLNPRIAKSTMGCFIRNGAMQIKPRE